MHWLPFPLQLPGGVELFVILLILVVPIAFVVAVALAVFLYGRRNSAPDADLERRIADLESRVRAIEDRQTEKDR